MKNSRRQQGRLQCERKESRGEGSGVWRKSTIISVKEGELKHTQERTMGLTAGRVWELGTRELEGEQHQGRI